MKLDATQLRYMSKEDFRLIQTVEMGSRNHEIVPISLICRMTKLRPQSATRQLQALAKMKLVSFEADSKYDGVRLTYGGYDFLALKAFSSRETVLSIGQQIGVGKESDIYLVHGTHHYENVANLEIKDEDEDMVGDGQEIIESMVVPSAVEFEERVLKIQRLGRTSFRTVKTNRDYHQHRSSCSWLYLSRLAAGLEFRFMKALKDVGMPVPKPLDWNRHCVVMEWIRGTLLDNVRLKDHQPEDDEEKSESESEECKSESEDLSKFEIENRVVEFINEDQVPILYARLMELIQEFASYGLIHGDFNEFNLLLTRDSLNRPIPIIIDFPQMVSIDHVNAKFYFERDVECIRTFFYKRFGFKNSEDEETETAAIFEPTWENIQRNESKKLDVELKASGYIKIKKIKVRKAKKVTAVVSDLDTETETESETDDSDEDSDVDSDATESDE